MFPHEETPTVTAVGVGDPDPDSVELVAETYEAEFGVPVSVEPTLSIPERSNGTGQRDAGDVFRTLEEHTDADFTLGVTDELIEFDNDFSVFGLATRGGGTGLVSTGSLTIDAPTATVERERIANATRHFAGRLFGFRTHEGCVMSGTRSLSDLDERSDEFCRDCTDRLSGPKTAPEPPHWEVLTEQAEEARTAIRWAQGDIRLAEYPLLAIGMLVDGAWRLQRRVPSPSAVALPRSVRAFAHESYRTVRFWWLILTYFAVFLAVVGLGLNGYESVAGGGSSDVATWAIVVAGLPVAYVVHAVLRSAFGGFFEATAAGARDGLSAEK